MITAEDNDRVLVKTAILEHIEQLSYTVIDVADSTIVGATSILDLIVGKLLVPQVADFKKSLAVGILLFLGNSDLGQGDINSFVKIPELLVDSVGVVRMREGDLKMEASVVSKELTLMICSTGSAVASSSTQSKQRNMYQKAISKSHAVLYIPSRRMGV